MICKVNRGRAAQTNDLGTDRLDVQPSTAVPRMVCASRGATHANLACHCCVGLTYCRFLYSICYLWHMEMCDMLERWAEIFHVLGNRERLRVLSLFLYHNDCLCACEVVDALELPQYQVAKSLYLLKKAKLLESSRDGRWAYYCLRWTDEIGELVDFLRVAIPRETCKVELARLNTRLAMRQNGRCVIGSRFDADEDDG